MLARLRLCAALGGAILLVTGCGTTSRLAAKQTGRHDDFPQLSPLAKTAPVSLEDQALPAPGAAQTVEARGAKLTVTVRRVIDPLRNSGAALPPRSRAIGVIVQIQSAGPKVYDSSATGDISVVPSRGVVTPVLATRGACRTPLDDFDRYVTAGEDRVGCVVFAVPAGAILDEVRFSPYARPRGRLEWAP